MTHPVHAMSTPMGRCLTILLLVASLDGCGGGGGGGGTTTPAKPVTPTLTSFVPASVEAGSPAFTLTVDGAGFAPGGSLSWNGTNLGPYTFVSSTQVTIGIGAKLVTSPGRALIVATNVDPSTKPSKSLPFTITPFAQSGCLLYGTYDFFFTGFDSSGAMNTAGVFGVDAAGNVSGAVDFKNRITTRVAEPITGGSCSNGADANTGTLSITTASGTSHYTFVTQGLPAPGIRGRMAESGDANGVSGTGKFVVLKPDFGFFTGDYMISAVGVDAGGHRMGLVGRFTDTATAGTTGTLSNGMGDVNDNGSVSAAVAITGSVTPPDASSRCVATLMIGSQPHTFAFYVLRPDAGFAIDIDPPGSGAVLAGLVSTQYLATLYSDANLNAPFVFSAWGAVPGSPATSETSVGVASSVGGNGSLTFEMDSVARGTAQVDQTVPASYSIAANGRGTLSYTLGGRPYNFVMYLDNNNDGSMLQTDTAGSVQYGLFEAQTASGFDNTTLNGQYAGAGWFNPVASSPVVAAQYNFLGGNLSGVTPAGGLTGSYTISATGRGSGSANQGVFGSNNFIFYVIDSDALTIMGADPVAGQGDAISLLHQ